MGATGGEPGEALGEAPGEALGEADGCATARSLPDSPSTMVKAFVRVRHCNRAAWLFDVPSAGSGRGVRLREESGSEPRSIACR